jgi:hypothetical protein
MSVDINPDPPLIPVTADAVIFLDPTDALEGVKVVVVFWIILMLRELDV